uniref:RNase H type-1 domain-containing protein n=1 Tax=Brassica oleracea TaxID=3712 RepID=A0A3P6E4E7_BRAOL|nr:unnamed protein product [Brassica oleracea]
MLSFTVELHSSYEITMAILTAELRCLEWALRSMKDLAYQEIVVEPDFHEPIEAVMQSSEWPRFRVLLQRINALCASFASIFICDGVCCL